MSLLRTITLVLLASLFMISCSEDDAVSVVDGENMMPTILQDFTNKTVIPTYKNMADNSIIFVNECEKFADGVNDAEVEAAANVWIETRIYWEQSEAFLFGPAAYNNLDPLIDSWPLDKDQLDQLLNQDDILDIDAAYVRDNLGASLRGFHATEYILFKDGAPRKASEISNKEIAYLRAVAIVLRDDCIALEAWWAGVSSLSTEKREMLNNAGIEIGSTFGSEIINAGKAGSRYQSQAIALEEIIQGCMDIADEVGNSKIADPAQSKNVLDVESWYSWNSLSDFKNNIKGIENVYMGGTSSRGTGLTQFVINKNQTLDAEIKVNIANAITKINEIGEPFRNNLNNTTNINEAIDACNKLMESISKIKNLI